MEPRSTSLCTRWSVGHGHPTRTPTRRSSQGVLTTPTPGSAFTSSTVTFDWRAGSPGPYSYWLDIGNSAGGNNYYSSGNLGTVTTTTVNGLPTTGGTVYVTLYTLISGSWYGNAYTYTALNGNLVAWRRCSRQRPGSTLSGTTVQRSPGARTANATAYWVDIGSSAQEETISTRSGNLGTALSDNSVRHYRPMVGPST
jgi:serine protease